jgi:hypothetical protein
MVGSSFLSPSAAISARSNLSSRSRLRDTPKQTKGKKQKQAARTL